MLVERNAFGVLELMVQSTLVVAPSLASTAAYLELEVSGDPNLDSEVLETFSGVGMASLGMENPSLQKCHLPWPPSSVVDRPGCLLTRLASQYRRWPSGFQYSNLVARRGSEEGRRGRPVVSLPVRSAVRAEGFGYPGGQAASAGNHLFSIYHAGESVLSGSRKARLD